MPTKGKFLSAFTTVSGVVALALIFLARAPVGSTLEAAAPGSAGGKKKADQPASRPASPFDGAISRNAGEMIERGRQIFRFDTFGSEAFWGDALQLHKAIAGEKNGGVGGGVSPKTALSVGLKVDADALPDSLKQQLKDGKVDLEDPAITLALLKLNAVVGVTGHFDKAGPSARWASSALSATRPSMIPSRPASGIASMGGRIAISTSAPSSRCRPI